MGIQCIEIGLLGQRRIRRPFVLRRLRSAVAAANASVVHFHHAGALVAGLSAVTTTAASAIVLTEHTDAALRASRLLRMRTQLALRSCDQVTTVAEHISQYFSDYLGVGSDRVHTVPNPVNPRYLIELGSTEGRPRRNGLQFLYVGRLVAEKGLSNLVDAVALVRDRLPPSTRVAIVGDGAERTALEHRVRSAGLQQVFEFRGASADPLVHYRAADAFVLPSLSEGAPLALLEAMACGLPCIATRVGSVAFLLRGEAGIVAEAGSPDSLADALLKVAESDSRRSELGTAARRRVEEDHRLEAVVDRYLEVFSQARARRLAVSQRTQA
jgi:glycosyltransferase involved in cell wall biosynthesis